MVVRIKTFAVVFVLLCGVSHADVDVIFKYSNDTAFWNRLAVLGYAERKDDEGNRLKVESRQFDPMTPVLQDVLTGDKYQRAQMAVEDADKIPSDSNPAFSIVWRSDVGGPEPQVTVYTYDENNTITGTRLQSIGRIAGH
jgi:hypothetical protein